MSGLDLWCLLGLAERSPSPSWVYSGYSRWSDLDRPLCFIFIFSQQLLVLKKSRFLLLTPLQVPRKQFCECPTSPEFLGASLWTWRGLRQLTFKGMPENMPLGLQWQLAQEFLSLQRKRESSLNETRNTDFRALENLVRLISILKNEDSVTTNHSLRIYLLSECNWIFI